MALSTPASGTSLDTADLVAAAPSAAATTSLWRDAWRRLRRNKLAVVGGVTVILLCLVAIFANALAPQSYTKANFGNIYEFPNREFPLGTDQLGRDVLSRMIYGARVSMLVGLGSQVIVLLIGVPLGALAGFIGGRTDILMTRFIDVMYAFPRLLFVILVMSMLGAGLVNIFIALGLTGWVGIARQTRAQVLTLKDKEFVEGARALGARGWRVLTRHVLPSALTPIVVSITFGIPEAIFTEAALSFIGVGITPPTPSWGQMVGENQQFLRSYWYLCVVPSIAIAVTMLSFAFLRDFLRVVGAMAAFGGLGFATRAEAAKPTKPGPGEKLAKDQVFRFGGGGLYQNDPASHDFNKDLYCSGVPALFAGLMAFNSDFVAVPWMASK